MATGQASSEYYQSTEIVTLSIKRKIKSRIWISGIFATYFEQLKLMKKCLEFETFCSFEKEPFDRLDRLDRLLPCLLKTAL